MTACCDPNAVERTDDRRSDRRQPERFPAEAMLRDAAQTPRQSLLLLGDCLTRCLLFAACYCAVLLSGSARMLYAASVSMGVLQVGLVATLFHECVHRNLSLPRSSQDWLARAVGAPLGLSLAWWRIKHVRLHHPHVGLIEIDPDIQFAAIARVKSDQEWRRQYRFQALHGPIACMLIGINMLSPKDLRRVTEHQQRRYVVLLLEKYGPFALVWTPVIWKLGLARGALVFLLFELTAGALGSVVVQLQHNTTLANRRSRRSLSSKFERQFFSTADTRSPLGVWWWLSGGTSRHVVHHLCPNLTYVQLPRATRIVRSYRVDWPEHRNVFGALAAHIRLISQLAKQSANDICQ